MGTSRIRAIPALLRSRAGNRGRDLSLPFGRSLPVPSRRPLIEDAGTGRYPAAGPCPPTGDCRC